MASLGSYRALRLAVLLACGEAATLGAPALAAPDVGPAARCVMHALPGTAQAFRLRDGRESVVAMGRRGRVARWTMGGAQDTRLVHFGSLAELDRHGSLACDRP